MEARSPHLGDYVIEGESFTPEEQFAILRPMISERRQKLFDRVLRNRTYSVTPVLEGLYDRGNISAVLRSAEGISCQSAHIIETSAKYKEANRVTQGAEKWLDVFRWNSTRACVEALRAQGYRILATSFENAAPIEDFDFTRPTALFFGNEKDGLTQELLELADAAVYIPMGGFSQSFNISVAAALCLYQARADRISRRGGQGDLTPKERAGLMASYYRRSVEHADRILREARTKSAAPAEEKQ